MKSNLKKTLLVFLVLGVFAGATYFVYNKWFKKPKDIVPTKGKCPCGGDDDADCHCNDINPDESSNLTAGDNSDYGGGGAGIDTSIPDYTPTPATIPFKPIITKPMIVMPATLHLNPIMAAEQKALLRGILPIHQVIANPTSFHLKS